jgi:hypothetical protein
MRTTKSRFPILAAIGFLGACLAAPALAQQVPPAGGPGPMPVFADFDLNKDGRITEDEFNEARAARIADRAQKGYPMRGLGNASSFADIDTNRDGTLSPAEFAAHQAAHRQQMMGR